MDRHLVRPSGKVRRSPCYLREVWEHWGARSDGRTDGEPKQKPVQKPIFWKNASYPLAIVWYKLCVMTEDLSWRLRLCQEHLALHASPAGLHLVWVANLSVESLQVSSPLCGKILICVDHWEPSLLPQGDTMASTPLRLGHQPCCHVDSSLSSGPGWLQLPWSRAVLDS